MTQQSNSISDLDFLQELINTPEPERGPRGPRKPKDIRDYDTWFKLDHHVMGTCSQGQNCAGLILDNKGPDRVTATVNDVEMCRFDFLDGLAYKND